MKRFIIEGKASIKGDFDVIIIPEFEWLFFMWHIKCNLKTEARSFTKSNEDETKIDDVE